MIVILIFYYLILASSIVGIASLLVWGMSRLGLRFGKNGLTASSVVVGIAVAPGILIGHGVAFAPLALAIAEHGSSGVLWQGLLLTPLSVYVTYRCLKFVVGGKQPNAEGKANDI